MGVIVNIIEANSEIVLLVAAAITLSVVLALLAPRLSRSLLGPAVIVASLIGAVMITNRTDVGRDAWGPALAVIAMFVGAVGIASGLILIGLGSARARRISGRSVTKHHYSKENPYRMPRSELLTYKGFFIFFAGTILILAVVAAIYSWLA